VVTLFLGKGKGGKGGMIQFQQETRNITRKQKKRLHGKKAYYYMRYKGIRAWTAASSWRGKKKKEEKRRALKEKGGGKKKRRGMSAI